MGPAGLLDLEVIGTRCYGQLDQEPVLHICLRDKSQPWSQKLSWPQGLSGPTLTQSRALQLQVEELLWPVILLTVLGTRMGHILPK